METTDHFLTELLSVLDFKQTLTSIFFPKGGGFPWLAGADGASALLLGVLDLK